MKLQLFQAPHRLDPIAPSFPYPVSYSEMLHNIGFGYSEELYAMASSWQSIYDAVKPDIILFEHSPTAMFAAKSLDVMKVLIGTGFTVPPLPLPIIRDADPFRVQEACANTDNTLLIANATAKRLGLGDFSSLEQIYSDVDKTFLMTYPEIDHFGERKTAQYLGAKEEGTGDVPQWPNCHGPKVFTYLQRFEQEQQVIAQLTQCPTSVIVYSPYLKSSDAYKLNSIARNIRFFSSPLNLSIVAAECDLAICHGGHGVTAQMLIEGVPVISLPIHQEQVLLGKRLEINELGWIIPTSQSSILGNILTEAFKNQATFFSAHRFSNKYKKGDLSDFASTIANCISKLLH
jgi:UDP:flavonoid glycosyltransferase YjiC (YdhE family)